MTFSVVKIRFYDDFGRITYMSFASDFVAINIARLADKAGKFTYF